MEIRLDTGKFCLYWRRGSNERSNTAKVGRAATRKAVRPDLSGEFARDTMQVCGVACSSMWTQLWLPIQPRQQRHSYWWRVGVVVS